MLPPSPYPIDNDLPFPIPITTFVAIILSFMYLYEQEAEDNRQQQLHQIAAIISIASTMPTRCYSSGDEDYEGEPYDHDTLTETDGKEEDIGRPKLHQIAAIISIASTMPTHCYFSGDEDYEGEPYHHATLTKTNGKEEDIGRPKKKRHFINRDRERARDAILADYLGTNPCFTERGFQQMFHISRNVYSLLKLAICMDPFYATSERDMTGRLNICTNAKMLIALKHLGYGAATSSWIDYFQMGESTAWLCVCKFCELVSSNEAISNHYLHCLTVEDARRVSTLHERCHGVPGMLGSLDCMHVCWKNCPIAFQGAYQGKEKASTLVLEAVAGFNLRFWHVAFGFGGSLNDINILDVSPLLTLFIDGSHLLVDFEYSIGEFTFHQPFYLVDGIYPESSCVVKTISIPVTKDKSRFCWMAGGVLQGCRTRLWCSPEQMENSCKSCGEVEQNQDTRDGDHVHHSP